MVVRPAERLCEGFGVALRDKEAVLFVDEPVFLVNFANDCWFAQRQALGGLSGYDPPGLVGVSKRTTETKVGVGNFRVDQFVEFHPLTVGVSGNSELCASGDEVSGLLGISANEVETDWQVSETGRGFQNDVNPVQWKK